jgi:hypothetical protein
MKKLYVRKRGNMWTIYNPATAYCLYVLNGKLKVTITPSKMDMKSRRNAIRQLKIIHPKAKHLGVTQVSNPERLLPGMDIFEV